MPHQKSLSLQKDVSYSVNLNYLLYLPPGYDQQEKWPLVLFLHGIGERGDDLSRVESIGLAHNIAEGEDFPFIAISPQCPLPHVWPELTVELNSLLDDIIANYAVDTSRIYLTGLSMGGYGTWYMAARFPERFAAIAPICGGGAWWVPEKLQNMPAWVFHGDADPVVPLHHSSDMVNALRELGNDVRFTVYPGVTHNSWTQTYQNPELYAWLLSHQKTD